MNKKNIINITLEYNYDILYFDKSFDFTMESCEKIQFEIDGKRIKITLIGNEFTHMIKDFLIQYRLLFYIFGYYLPILEAISIVDEKHEILNILDGTLIKYIANKQFINFTYQFTKIDKKTFYDSIIKLKETIDKDKTHNLQSFEYLLCNDYAKLLIDHRFTLASHTIEGYSKIFCPDKKLLINHKNKETYEKKVDYFLSEFFKITTSADILTSLETEKDKFTNSIVETRIFYSHMTLFEGEHFIIKGGKNLLQYFLIYTICFRLNILKLLNCNIDVSMLSENIKILHDWIIEGKKGTCFKSDLYRFKQLIKNFKSQN